jgi:hypothetical protein
MGKQGTRELLDYLRGIYGMIDKSDLKGKNRWIQCGLTE